MDLGLRPSIILKKLFLAIKDFHLQGGTMKQFLLRSGFLALLSSAALAGAATDLNGPAMQLFGRQILSDLNGDLAGASIRGTKALWIDAVIQSPVSSTAFANLEADLKSSDMEGLLIAAGLKVMDPKKRSFATGLRPTLEVMILRSPQGATGSDQGFYLVITSALQDVKPLGGDEAQSMITWCTTGAPIPFSGDDDKDVAAIRSSARDGVTAFIAQVKGTNVSASGDSGAAKP
jgi:hypothetical protein